MDVSTGHLVADLNSVPEHLRHRYTPVPDALRELAEKELAGQQETVVNMRRRDELARWAKAEKSKNRARNKLAKKSRARNR